MASISEGCPVPWNPQQRGMSMDTTRPLGTSVSVIQDRRSGGNSRRSTLSVSGMVFDTSSASRQNGSRSRAWSARSPGASPPARASRPSRRPRSAKRSRSPTGAGGSWAGEEPTSSNMATLAACSSSEEEWNPAPTPGPAARSSSTASCSESSVCSTARWQCPSLRLFSCCSANSTSSSSQTSGAGQRSGRSSAARMRSRAMSWVLWARITPRLNHWPVTMAPRATSTNHRRPSPTAMSGAQRSQKAGTNETTWVDRFMA